MTESMYDPESVAQSLVESNQTIALALVESNKAAAKELAESTRVAAEALVAANKEAARELVASNQLVTERLLQGSQITASILHSNSLESSVIAAMRFKSQKIWNWTAICLHLLTFIILAIFTVAFFEFAIIVQTPGR